MLKIFTLTLGRGLFVKSAIAATFQDVVVGEDFFQGRPYKDKTAVIVGYEVRTGSHDGPLVESSNDKKKMPILFTLGTGAVVPAADDVIRTMRPGGIRRFEFDKDGTTYYVTMRLRAVKGFSNFNVCTAAPQQRQPPLLCEPGALRKI